MQCLVFNPDGGGPGVLSVTLSLVFLLFVSLLESSVVGFLCLVVQKFRVQGPMFRRSSIQMFTLFSSTSVGVLTSLPHE